MLMTRPTPSFMIFVFQVLCSPAAWGQELSKEEMWPQQPSEPLSLPSATISLISDIVQMRFAINLSELQVISITVL